MRLVKVISTALSKIKHEIFKDDLAEDRIFSVVECVPIKDQKVLKLKLEGGETIIIPGEILSTSLNPGEKRLKATDNNGVEKITLTLYNDGKFEIKATQGDMTALLADTVTALKDLMTSLSTATVPTMLGPQLLSIAPDLISKLPAMILTDQNMKLFKK